jgi:riboflavin kinase/FMN adenylyltransferase
MKYTGIVQKYSQRGRSLGYPTVNIRLVDPEPSGSYVATVTSEGKRYAAAAYADQERGLLEAHLLDFAGDLYGKEISMELLQKIREPEVFSHDDELKRAIAADVAKVRDYFQNH